MTYLKLMKINNKRIRLVRRMSILAIGEKTNFLIVKTIGDGGPIASLPKSNSITKNVNRNFDSRANGTINNIPRSFILTLESNLIKNKVETTYPVVEMVDQVIDFHNQLIKDHKIIDGTKRFNIVRTYIINLMERKPGNENPPFTAVSNRHKFPSSMFKMLDLFLNVVKRKCQTSDRTIRSIFYINRLCSDNNKPDFSTITQEHKVADKTLIRFRNFIRKWKESKNFDHSPDLITEPTEKIVSNGPNGKPKWETADIEAKALSHSILWLPFKSLCDLTGNQNLALFVERVAENCELSIENVRLRYVTSIADKGNKCRLVAISDYWTQLLLRPLMKDVQYLIQKHFKGVSSAKSHKKGFNRLKKCIRKGVKSYDISSWTDAFPASLQKIVLEELYSPELAEHWSTLVVKCEWNTKNSKTSIQYGTGQGMGTAGSFDIATLTDLLVLEMLYVEEYGHSIKKNKSTLYNKVGDDLWCYDPENYIYIFYTKDLNLGINIMKTKSVSPDNNVGEYVSRNINNSKDVSRISANICRSIQKNILNIPELARHLEERDVNSIPVKKIIRLTNRKNEFLIVKTLYILTLMKPYEEGMHLLKIALLEDYGTEIHSDPLLALLKDPDNLNVFKHTFLIDQIQGILPLIEIRMQTIFKAQMPGYECTLDFIKQHTKEFSFKYRDNSVIGHDESLPLITTQYTLAKCYRLLNSVFKLRTIPDLEDVSNLILEGEFEGETPQEQKPSMMVITSSKEEASSEASVVSFNELDDLLSNLDKILQGLTFKDLGVINSGSEKAYRPITTKLYNFTNSILLRDMENSLDNLEGTGVSTSIGQFVYRIKGKNKGNTVGLSQALKSLLNFKGTEELISEIED
jgi:hypothetical protein